MNSFLNSKQYNLYTITLPIIFYLGMLSFCYSANSLNIFFFFIIPISFISSLMLGLLTIINRKSIKFYALKSIFLFSPLVMVLSSTINHDKTVLEAEKGDSIFGHKLYLYPDKKFRFEERNLLGTRIRKGQYKIIGTEVQLKYFETEFYEYDVVKLQVNGKRLGKMEILKNELILPVANSR